MNKGQWIKIISMQGEPQMSGKIGQYNHTDSKGQLQGSWGLAIQPGDSYVLLSDEEVKKIQDEEAAKKAAFKAPHVKPEIIEVTFTFPLKLSRLESLNGMKSKNIAGRVVIHPNGSENYSNTYGNICNWIAGIREDQCRSLVDQINSKLKVKCCWTMEVKPCDARKSVDDCMAAINEAVRLLNEAL